MSYLRVPRSGRYAAGVVLITVMVPVAVLGIGLWEMQRGNAGRWELEAQRGSLDQTVRRMESWLTANPGRELQLQFRRDGQMYVGSNAVDKARETLDQSGTAVAIERWRRVLPPVTIGCAGLAAVLSVSILAAAAAFARAGRTSREALLRGFSVLHRLLPPMLGLQVVAVAVCAVTVVAFEAMAILEIGDLSSGSLKVLLIAAVLIGASLWTAIKAVLQLRRTVALFTPEPMVVLGRSVSMQDAPGLWRLMTELAAGLGALRPDDVVVGLTGGFFVSSGPKLLRPGETELTGRTLYVPLPYLPLLRADELAAIIGHELAHFSGADTDYSLRFLPIYAGVERSLDAVIAAGTTSAGTLSLLAWPSLRLGIFAMRRFHYAVRHWSRLREFAADAAGASVTTPDAAARALLRTAAAEARIDDTLDAAFQAPEAASADLVATTLDAAVAHGLDDPGPRLGERQPHPTDSHPPTQQRLAALGHAPSPAMLAEAALPPRADARSRLSDLFADPDALCRAATADFLDIARARVRRVHEAMEEAAAAVDATEYALRADRRAVGYVYFGAAILLLLAGSALLAFGMQGLSWHDSAWLGGGVAAAGLAFASSGLVLLRTRRAPFLLLRPTDFTLPGLDRPIAWAHVVDLDMVIDRGRISTRLLLSPEAPLPARTSGRRRIRLDAERRIVTFTAGLPRGMKAQGYADLLARYRTADLARRALAAETTSHPDQE